MDEFEKEIIDQLVELEKGIIAIGKQQHELCVRIKAYCDMKAKG